MKLRKKIYIYIKGFIYGILTAPINALAWIYCTAVKWPKEDIYYEEGKEEREMKKYKLTKETKDVIGITLRRIRALRDMPSVCVKAGDLGGWIAGEHNLSQNGNAWVCDEAMVYENAMVYGNAMVSGDATVCGEAKVFDDATVCGSAVVYGSAKVFEKAKVDINAKVDDSAKVYGTAIVSGNACVSRKAKVSGNAMVYGDAVVSGDATVSNDAMVYGKAVVSGNAEVYNKSDYMGFKNSWSSGRWITYTCSNKMWSVGCFYGTGEELIRKAYADSELSGKCYETIVRAVEAIEKAKAESKGDYSLRYELKEKNQ